MKTSGDIKHSFSLINYFWPNYSAQISLLYKNMMQQFTVWPFHYNFTALSQNKKIILTSFLAFLLV